MKIKIRMENDKRGKGGGCLWNKHIKGLFLAAVGQDTRGPRQRAVTQGCVLFGPLSPSRPCACLARPGPNPLP